MFKYNHEQFGWVIVLAMSAVFLCTTMAIFISNVEILSANNIEAISYMLMGIGMLEMLLLAFFYKLTVKIDHEKIYIIFGIGIIKMSYYLREIQTAKQVRNPWWLGWGIRYAWKYWAYNVSGFDAVELKMKSGSIIRIGTDDPTGLEKALNSH